MPAGRQVTSLAILLGARLKTNLEGWQSGRMRRSRKPFGVKASRRFKSSPLRHSSGLGSGAGLSSRAGGLQNRSAQSVAVHEGLQKSTRSTGTGARLAHTATFWALRPPAARRRLREAFPRRHAARSWQPQYGRGRGPAAARDARRVRCDRPRGTSTTSPRLPGVTATNWVTTCAPSSPPLSQLAEALTIGQLRTTWPVCMGRVPFRGRLSRSPALGGRRKASPAQRVRGDYGTTR